MTDEPAPEEGAAPDPSRDRARIEPSAPAKKSDLLPILYIVGFVALAGAVYFLWQNPPEARLAAQDAGKVDTLQEQVVSLRDAVARLEQQKPPTPGPSATEFQQLQSQVNALAGKPVASETEVQQLQQQVVALASKSVATPDQVAQLTQQVLALAKQEPDLTPLTTRIDALEKRPVFDPASLDPKFAAVSDKVQQLATQNDQSDAKMAQTLKDLQAKVDELEKQQKAIAQKTQLAARLQGAATALAAGQKLGTIPGAPPALARFSSEAPPTEASLRASFDTYAAEAQKASQPTVSDNQDFASRLWARAQQSVTVRQGEHVLVGDPIAGVIAHAREQLDTGNLAGAVQTLKSLSGAPAKAMQPWMDRATALLDARAAIASMVTG